MSSLAKAGALFSVCVKLLMISIENEKIVVEYMWQKFEYTYDFLHFALLCSTTIALKASFL